MSDEQSPQDLARRMIEGCAARRWMIATAESCTGGMIVSRLTDIAGSSVAVDRGFVTYSNDAKSEMLGVSRTTLARHGAVSAETAAEMAQGALDRSNADIALAVTGIAGPGGGSDDKPVGLVWFGLAVAGHPVETERQVFEDRGRDFIRRETVRHALEMGLRALEADQTAGAP